MFALYFKAISLILLALSATSARPAKSRCTVTQTQTITNYIDVVYSTVITTVTQDQGSFTTTVYAEPITKVVIKPETIYTSMSTSTVTVKTATVRTTTTETVTNDAATASYTKTIILSTASVITTVLLETSDASANFKIWGSLQVLLLILGSAVFFI